MLLQGSEVKSLRLGRASIAESYAGENNGRLVLFNANIPIYEPARDNHEPKRPRELLVSARERNKLLGLIRREGMTLVPLAIYFNDRGLCKLSLGLAKGRKKQGKRRKGKEKARKSGKARKSNEKARKARKSNEKARRARRTKERQGTTRKSKEEQAPQR